LTSCGGCPRDPNSPASVVVEPVKVQESSPTVIVPGVLIPKDKVDIKSQSAVRIAEVFANKGDRVSIGSPLVRFAEDEINVKLNQLRSALKEAEAAVDKNQFLLKNRDRLLEEGRIDKTQYDGLSTEVSHNEASVEKLKADIAAVEFSATRLQLTSPISGIVTEKYASPMQMAAENQVLFTIENIDPILVSFSLSSNESAGIKIGTPITVRIEDLDNSEYGGQVVYISPDISQPGKTFDVWAAVSNPNSILKSGMIATAEFISTNIHKIYAVPSTSVISRNRDKYVFTVNNGVARQVKVSIRNVHDNIAEISEGLSENDFIVAKGAENLQDGTPVDMFRR